MARIRLEFVPIRWLALGWLGFDHLQLVLEPSCEDKPVRQDDWYVLEGTYGRSRRGLVVYVSGADGTTTLAAANLATGACLEHKIGTPESRGSVVLPVEGDPLLAWQRMASAARQINDSQLSYTSLGLVRRFHPVINSSSVVASLLLEIGIDVHDHLPRGVVFSPGTDTLLGAGRPRGLPAGHSAFDTLVGGEGDDDLAGCDDATGLKKLYGGRGNDTFRWTSGTSYIHGGQPGLAVHADGYDTVDYRGAGRIEVRPGARSFPFKRSDYVVAFSGGMEGRSGGVDLLTSIEHLLVDARTDRLAVSPRLTRIPKKLDIDMHHPSCGRGIGLLDLSAARRGISIRAKATDSIELAVGVQHADRVWNLRGVRHVVGSAQDDHIQMSATLHVAEGGPGNDVIDARLVTPGHASAFCGYDAEIDGGPGDDVLIACRGRTFARGGEGSNTFILPKLGEPCAKLAPELVIADAKPGDCLLVPDGMPAERRASQTRLTQVCGALDEV